ncbi:MAG: N-acetylglutamate synthase related acetyltransferase [halophilic archaeon J07HX64]|jgi:N-acetylglutamate synthase and related acetyltransferases|nr:MAG: N-acetylglutamate synthase related acetyltransferase [halophilic archaeon J07HX64]
MDNKASGVDGGQIGIPPICTLKSAHAQLHKSSRRHTEAGGETPDEAARASVTLQPADEREMDRIERLLAANDLPHGDLGATPASFYHATDGGALVGIDGIERRGSHGLLRSVVVPEPRRGRGYGTRLVAALEERARTEGKTLYLLTTTASVFFRRCGCEETARERVPPEIRRTAEFTEHCPASATCLRKRLR